jgi:hypothetical protein
MGEKSPFGRSGWQQTLLRVIRQAHYWAARRLGGGVRTLVGILFIIGGIFGFLPILGFWMIPVGILIVAMEFPRFQKPIRAWLFRKKIAAVAAKDGSVREESVS